MGPCISHLVANSMLGLQQDMKKIEMFDKFFFFCVVINDITKIRRY